jgi:hypothetical protein
MEERGRGGGGGVVGESRVVFVVVDDFGDRREGMINDEFESVEALKTHDSPQPP